jgi:hypothetical protein
MKNVKGALFIDYVRMLRSKKGADWSRHLAPDDLRFLHEHIELDAWYPMGAFERMGVAILAEVAQGDLNLVREWGRYSIDWLCAKYPNLVAHGDPCESLMRFQVQRQTFFDYPALAMREVHEGGATVVITYGMSARAEEAASYQTMGFFERLLEVSGAKDVKVTFGARSWNGAPETILSMEWSARGHSTSERSSG